MIEIESAGITDVGKKRKNNEDALFLDDTLKLYVVADGMGGHLAGEVASRIVVNTIRDYMARFGEDEAVDELAVFDEGLSQPANRLLAGIQLANGGVFEVSRQKESCRGMGSTVASILFTDSTLVAANVGDSPIFLVHNGAIELLSVQHTVMAEQLAINPERASRLGREYQHVLTRAIGIDEHVDADICEIQCFRGDVMVLSSDGLTDKVSPQEILETVRLEKPEKACRALVDLANERGGDDNVTVIVLKVKAVRSEKNPIYRALSHLWRLWKRILGI